MIGVSNGTTSSRGVRAVSWKRRRARVASGPNDMRRRERGSRTADATEDTWFSFRLGGRDETVAGQPQVDVIERGSADCELTGEAELADRRERVAAGQPVQRDGEARAHGEGIVVS